MNVLRINFVLILHSYLQHFSGIHCAKSGNFKNEGGLNNHDAYALAGNEVLDLFCRALAAPRRHTAVIRDIWFLQLQLLKRTGSAPMRTMEHQNSVLALIYWLCVQKLKVAKPLN